MHNEYLNVLARGQFEDTPKSVWAAIAVSLAYQLQGEGDDANRFAVIASYIDHEWHALYKNGIVPQKPRPRKEARNG